MAFLQYAHPPGRWGVGRNYALFYMQGGHNYGNYCTTTNWYHITILSKFVICATLNHNLHPGLSNDFKHYFAGDLTSRPGGKPELWSIWQTFDRRNSCHLPSSSHHHHIIITSSHHHHIIITSSSHHHCRHHHHTHRLFDKHLIGITLVIAVIISH